MMKLHMDLTREAAIKLLVAGICRLTYLKENGEGRIACGTLNASYIPEEKIPVKTTNQTDGHIYNGIIKYFDLDVQGWRSFKLERLTSIAMNHITEIAL